MTLRRKVPYAQSILERVIVIVYVYHTIDRYQYTGSYHGVIHSHLDAVDCHVMFEGKEYRPADGRHQGHGRLPQRQTSTRSRTASSRAASCSTRTRLPGKASPQGWLEPGTAIHRETSRPWKRLSMSEWLPAMSFFSTPVGGSDA